ncbi:MAG: hypothetical protein ABI318_14630, partial [Chthoniobacteraceae bacterium]
KRVLQKRPGIQFPENADDYHIEMTGGSFAGQPVAKWVIEFPDRKFASAAVTLKTEGNASTVHKDFCNQLVAKYGPSTADKKTSGTSKTKGAQQAVPSKMTVWKFPATMKEKSVVLISAELTGVKARGGEDPNAAVTIKYVNETLTGTAGTADGKPAPKTITPIKKEDL